MNWTQWNWWELGMLLAAVVGIVVWSICEEIRFRRSKK